jgi:hypothetical protein
MPHALTRHPAQAFDYLNDLAHLSQNARAILDLRDVADAVLRFRGGHWRHEPGHQTTIEVCADRQGTKFLICGRPSGGKVLIMLPFESRHQGALAAFEERLRRRQRVCCWLRWARRLGRWLDEALR